MSKSEDTRHAPNVLWPSKRKVVVLQTVEIKVCEGYPDLCNPSCPGHSFFPEYTKMTSPDCGKKIPARAKCRLMTPDGSGIGLEIVEEEGVLGATLQHHPLTKRCKECIEAEKKIEEGSEEGW